MENRDTNEIREAYRNLAQAVGFDIDEKEVESYVKHLINSTLKLVIQEGNTSIAGLTRRINGAVADVENIKKTTSDWDIAISSAVEMKKIDYEKDCERILNEKLNALKQLEFSEQPNPFHNAIEDFLGQLEAHSFPNDGKGEALSAFINSMGYLYWQSNAKKKPSDDEYEPSGGLINMKGRKPFGKRS